MRASSSKQPGRIVFRTTRGLPVANGLTVAGRLAKGRRRATDATTEVRGVAV